MAVETLSTLSATARGVVVNLGWEIYHTPENLTLFLIGEAAELGEFCQWPSRDQLLDSPVLAAVREEIADVVKSVLYLANVVPAAPPLEPLLREKLRLDVAMYPVDRYRGVHRYQVETHERRKSGIVPLPERWTPEDTPLPELQRLAWQFTVDRAWERYYTPSSLALAVCVKSGEVATCYQRRPKPIEEPYARMVWAMADIILNVLRLAEYLGLPDVGELVLEKLKRDETRFAARRPAQQADSTAGPSGGR